MGLFDVFINAIAGGASAAHHDRLRQDNGGEPQDGDLWASLGRCHDKFGDSSWAAYCFGYAGERKGERHSRDHHWLWG